MYGSVQVPNGTPQMQQQNGAARYGSVQVPNGAPQQMHMAGIQMQNQHVQQMQAAQKQAPPPQQPAPGAEIRGVGIKFGERIDPSTGGMTIYVKRILKAGPADTAGVVAPGDVLVSLDGARLNGAGLDVMRSRIPGAAGSTVCLGFRPASGPEYVAALTRSAYGEDATPDVPWDMIAAPPNTSPPLQPVYPAAPLNPSMQGYAQAQQGYPPPQGYAPQQQQQGYAPPQQGYAPPPQQGYAAPPQGFSPPQQLPPQVQQWHPEQHGSAQEAQAPGAPPQAGAQPYYHPQEGLQGGHGEEEVQYITRTVMVPQVQRIMVSKQGGQQVEYIMPEQASEGQYAQGAPPGQMQYQMHQDAPQYHHRDHQLRTEYQEYQPADIAASLGSLSLSNGHPPGGGGGGGEAPVGEQPYRTLASLSPQEQMQVLSGRANFSSGPPSGQQPFANGNGPTSGNETFANGPASGQQNFQNRPASGQHHFQNRPASGHQNGFAQDRMPLGNPQGYAPPPQQQQQQQQEQFAQRQQEPQQKQARGQEHKGSVDWNQEEHQEEMMSMVGTQV